MEIEVAAVEITPLAATKIRDIMDQQGEKDAAIRVVVVGMACSGPQYMMAFDKEHKEDDVMLEMSGVKFLADPDTYGVLVGSKIDYVDDLMHQGFTIVNPNAAAGGCGEGCSCGGNH